MTAYSKAAKRALKRGRPRLVANMNDREPNGQLSRRREASEGRAMDVAVQTRIRHLGLVDNKVETAERQAVDPRRGYVLGLLLLDRKITKPQHDAGVRYAEDMARYYGLSGVPFPSVRAQNLFAVRGEAGESDARILAAQAARQTMKSLQKALLATGDIDTGRRVEHTVKSVCLLDLPESRGWPEHMASWLVRGLNSLAKFYQI